MSKKSDNSERKTSTNHSPFIEPNLASLKLKKTQRSYFNDLLWQVREIPCFENQLRLLVTLMKIRIYCQYTGPIILKSPQATLGTDNGSLNQLFKICHTRSKQEGYNSTLDKAFQGELFASNIDVNGLKNVLVALNTYIKKEVCYLDISTIRRQRNQEAVNEETKGKALLGLLGYTGVGKSTTMHMLMRSKLEFNEGRLRIWHAHVSNMSRIGHSTQSCTKRLHMANLAVKGRKKIGKQHDLVQQPIFLGDLPGWGDTDGEEAKVLNTLRIATPLAYAGSLRFLVLIKADYGAKAEGLLDTLAAVSQLLPRLTESNNRDADSVFFAFVGGPSHTKLPAQVIRDMNELLTKSASALSSNHQIEMKELDPRITPAIRILLQRFKTIIAGKEKNIPYIEIYAPGTNRIPKVRKDLSKVGDQLLERVITSTRPINDPRQAVLPFVEKNDKATLYLQLEKHQQTIAAALQRLLSPLQQTTQEDDKSSSSGHEQDMATMPASDEDMALIKSKVADIVFLRNNLPDEKVLEKFNAVIKLIKEARAELKQSIAVLLNVNVPVLLNDKLLNSIRSPFLISFISEMLMNLGQTVDAETMHFFKNDVIRFTKAADSIIAKAINTMLPEDEKLSQTVTQQVAILCENLRHIGKIASDYWIMPNDHQSSQSGGVGSVVPVLPSINEKKSAHSASLNDNSSSTVVKIKGEYSVNEDWFIVGDEDGGKKVAVHSGGSKPSPAIVSTETVIAPDSVTTDVKTSNAEQLPTINLYEQVIATHQHNLLETAEKQFLDSLSKGEFNQAARLLDHYHQLSIAMCSEDSPVDIMKRVNMWRANFSGTFKESHQQLYKFQIDTRMTANEAKQFSGFFSLFDSLKKSTSIKRQFALETSAESHKDEMRAIGQQIISNYKNRFKRICQITNAIVQKKEEMLGIVKLPRLIEEVAIMLSVETPHAPNIKKTISAHWQKNQQSIQHFISTFAEQFISILKQPGKLQESPYSNIVRYIAMFGEEKTHQQIFPDEKKSPRLALVGTIEARIARHIVILDQLILTVASSPLIEQHSWRWTELDSLFSLTGITGLLSEDCIEKGKKACQNYQQKLDSIHCQFDQLINAPKTPLINQLQSIQAVAYQEKIGASSSSSYLIDPAYLAEYQQFIRVCDQQQVSTAEAKARFGLVTRFQTQYLAEQTQRLEAALDILAQRPNDQDQQFAAALQMCQLLFAHLTTLSSSQAFASEVTSTAGQAWQKTLRQLYDGIEQKLSQALITLSGGKDNSEKKEDSGSTIKTLCEAAKALSALDKYLPNETSSSGYAINFIALFRAYDDCMKQKFGPVLSEILRHIQQGQYQQAIKAMEKHTDSHSAIRNVVKSQAQQLVLRLVHQMEQQLRQLQTDKIGMPDDLQWLVKTYTDLTKYDVLYKGTLINKTVVAACADVLRRYPEVIKAWRQQVVKQTQASLTKTLAFASGFQVLERLEETAKIVGETVVLECKAERNAIETCMQETHMRTLANFNKAFANWKVQPLSVAMVAQSYGAAGKAILSGSTFADRWTQLGQCMTAKTEESFSSLLKRYQGGQTGIKESLEALASILQRFVGLRQYDADLLAVIHALGKEAIQALQAGIFKRSTEDQDSKSIVHDAIVLVESLEKNLAPFYGKATTELAKVAFEYIDTYQAVLVDSILASLGNKQFPTRDLISLSDLIKALPDQESLKTAQDKVQQALNAFIRQHIQDIVMHLQVFSPENYQQKDLDKETCLGGLTLLVTMEDITQEDIVFDVKVIADYINDVVRALQKKLEDNLTSFGGYLKAKRASRAVKAYQFADWLSPFAAIVAKLKAAATMGIHQYAGKTQNAMLDAMQYLCEQFIGLVKKADVSALKQQQFDRTLTFKEWGKHFDFIVGFEQEYKSENNFSEKYSKIIAHYIQTVFDAAGQQIPKRITPQVSWDLFSRYLRELSMFSAACTNNKNMTEICYDSGQKHSVTNADNALLNHLKVIIEQGVIAQQDLIKDHSQALPSDGSSQDSDNKATTDLHAPDQYFWQQIVTFLLSLQKIADEITELREHTTRQIGIILSSILSPQALQMVSNLLRADSEGLGPKLINEQAIFRGIAIQLRNQRTKAHGIDEVLEGLTVDAKGEETSIDLQTKKILNTAYTSFEKTYNTLLKKYLQPQNDLSKADNLKKCLAELAAKLNANSGDDKSLSDELPEPNIPEQLAYFFAIWTLSDAKHYFQSGCNQECLKKPHAAQIVAAFMMLNLADKGNTKGLINQLVQVLTGEGKSVVFAAVAVALALQGYDVFCSCYSDYLSQRDWKDFADYFKQIGVDKLIFYGTINQVFEKVINADGDLRDMIRTLIEPNSSSDRVVSVTLPNKRVLMVDEWDVFTKQDFFGSLYQPTLLISNEHTKALVATIWNTYKDHRENLMNAQHIYQAVLAIKETLAYKHCLQQYPESWHFIFESALEGMLKDLAEYEPQQGHRYRVHQEKIGYNYQDGVTVTETRGYKTQWAYFSEYEKGNIPEHQRNAHTGVLVNAGAFSYTEMLRSMQCFEHVLGVTGTLRELCPAEQAIVRELDINDKSYFSSMFGVPKRVFKSKAHVHTYAKQQYHAALTQAIEAARQPINNATLKRPVLVFFDTEQELNAFKESKAFADYRKLPTLTCMTRDSSSSPEQRATEMTRAVSANGITLATGHFGRGRDFKCFSQRVLNAGGIHVLGACFPTTLAEEVQWMGRGGRQGRPGSFSLMLESEKLKQVFDIPDKILQAAVDADTLYETLCEYRNNRLGQIYTELNKNVTSFVETAHKPSMLLLRQAQLVQSSDLQLERKQGSLEDKLEPLAQLQKSLAKFNPVQAVKMQRPSRTLILMDATNSMGNLIAGVRYVIGQLMTTLSQTLQQRQIPSELFAVQLAVYRNYDATNVFQLSEWSSQPTGLQTFINAISVNGGLGREAMEVGFRWANMQADEKPDKRLTNVIVIGDRAGNTSEGITVKRHDYRWPERNSSSGHWYNQLYGSAIYEAGQLAGKGVKIDAFYVKSTEPQEVKSYFEQLATIGGGQAAKLDLSNREQAANNIAQRISHSIFKDIAQGNRTLLQQLVYDFGKNFQAPSP